MFQRVGSRGMATEEGEAAAIAASRGASSAIVMAPKPRRAAPRRLERSCGGCRQPISGEPAYRTARPKDTLPRLDLVVRGLDQAVERRVEEVAVLLALAGEPSLPGLHVEGPGERILNLFQSLSGVDFGFDGSIDRIE